MSVLDVKNLTYLYSENTPLVTAAVKDISFSVNKGEIFGIIGHTGSGKSTLLQMLNGLLKPSSGKIFFCGKDIWENPKKMKQIRSKIGLVFQYPEYQLFEETVIDDIAFGPMNMGLSKEDAIVAAKNAANIVKLSDELLSKSCFDLSGGEKRRAAIAGIMAMNPEIIVFDEPTAGLDPIGRKTILDAVLEYRKNNNATVIIVSHSMEDMAGICDRIMVLNNGEKLLLDSVDGVYKNAELLNNIGLSVPYVTQVMLGLKKLGLNVKTDCYTVSSAAESIIDCLRRADNA